jgi:hypothetical protein
MITYYSNKLCLLRIISLAILFTIFPVKIAHAEPQSVVQPTGNGFLVQSSNSEDNPYDCSFDINWSHDDFGTRKQRNTRGTFSVSPQSFGVTTVQESGYWVRVNITSSSFRCLVRRAPKNQVADRPPDKGGAWRTEEPKTTPSVEQCVSVSLGEGTPFSLTTSLFVQNRCGRCFPIRVTLSLDTPNDPQSNVARYGTAPIAAPKNQTTRYDFDLPVIANYNSLDWKRDGVIETQLDSDPKTCRPYNVSW